MFKLAALSGALVLSVGACGSPEVAPTIAPSIETTTPATTTEEPKVAVTTETSAPEITQTAELLSATAMKELFDVRLDIVRQQYPGTISELQILSLGDSASCRIDSSLSFTVEGSDPTVAYNCLEEQKIVVAGKFIDRHLRTHSDPETAANIVLAHELGHSVMDDLGIDAITTDKTNGERMADCLAGNTFSAFPPEEKVNLKAVFSETIQPVSDDIAGREAAFSSGLAGETCNL
jgi:hypothetical protein